MSALATLETAVDTREEPDETGSERKSGLDVSL